MKFLSLFILVCGMLLLIATTAFTTRPGHRAYRNSYQRYLKAFGDKQQRLAELSKRPGVPDKAAWSEAIREARKAMKPADFWLRYLDPNAYRRINGALPVEWETEVYEKFEKPYFRQSAGFTVLAGCLEADEISIDSLRRLVDSTNAGLAYFQSDSVAEAMDNPRVFYCANRLFLLNLASVYTTGFECPDTAAILPELREMLSGVAEIYKAFEESYPETAPDKQYVDLFSKAIAFVAAQQGGYENFDHYRFLRNYVNPLFKLNQEFMIRYRIASRSLVDYSLNLKANSIFDKALFRAQNPKGVFLRVTDSADLATINRLGHLLFYDPILSGNNARSCASCHNPQQGFTQNEGFASLSYDRIHRLARNTPSLANAQFQHLVMTDGRHVALQDQTIAVITNPQEMGGREDEIVRKVQHCKTYREGFAALMKYTPQLPQLSLAHISSAITFYYGQFGQGYAPFDEAMEAKSELSAGEQHGFNLFMGKAKCGTCHFVPQFNGVKPPFNGSEFEVLGVPATADARTLDSDRGRYLVHPAGEMDHAFRTPTLRNIARSFPYMHNGVFSTLDEVLEFYNQGGGTGTGIALENQTLPGDKLGLSEQDKRDLKAFLLALNEQVDIPAKPLQLPVSSIKRLNKRRPGGEY